MLVKYDLCNRTQYEAFIRVFYFSFTTMTTIGLGDYRPWGSPERMFVTFMLIFGVMILTYIMGNLIDLLYKYANYMGDIEESELLSRFFNTLKQFNGMEPFNKDKKREMEEYF
jgi:hypothetical protein